MARYEIAKQVEIHTSDTTERFFIGVSADGNKVAVRLHVRGSSVPFQPIQLTDTLRTVPTVVPVPHLVPGGLLWPVSAEVYRAWESPHEYVLGAAPSTPTTDTDTDTAQEGTHE